MQIWWCKNENVIDFRLSRVNQCRRKHQATNFRRVFSVEREKTGVCVCVCVQVRGTRSVGFNVLLLTANINVSIHLARFAQQAPITLKFQPFPHHCYVGWRAYYGLDPFRPEVFSITKTRSARGLVRLCTQPCKQKEQTHADQNVCMLRDPVTYIQNAMSMNWQANDNLNVF